MSWRIQSATRVGETELFPARSGHIQREQNERAGQNKCNSQSHGFTPLSIIPRSKRIALVLAPDDPRHERLYLAVLRGQEAQENGDAESVSGTNWSLRIAETNAVSGYEGTRLCSDKGMKIALDMKAPWKGLPLVVAWVAILGIVGSICNYWRSLLR